MESKLPKNLIGHNLRQFRIAANLNQAEFSAKLIDVGLDIKPCMICKIEKQMRHVLDYELIAFSRILNKPVSAFFDELHF